MWSSVNRGMPVAPVQFGARQPAKVADSLMQRLNAELDKARENTYLHEAKDPFDSDIIITRKRTDDPNYPVQIEFLVLNGSREIVLAPNGLIIRATCAGKSAQRPLARDQAKSIVENFLMQVFVNKN